VIRKRKEELRHAQDIREHYMRKLDRTHNLYLQLNAFLGQLESRDKELRRREEKLGIADAKTGKGYKPMFKNPGCREPGRRTAFLMTLPVNQQEDSSPPNSPQRVIGATAVSYRLKIGF